MAAPRSIYTRVYSGRSASQLVSGKGSKGTLSYGGLLREFWYHADKENTEPTALVSVSNRIIDTVKRALEKHLLDQESPGDIWIVFIERPKDGALVHSARRLAERCGHETPWVFKHEMVFEWAIPKNCVLHTVSLQTLLDRELDWTKFIDERGCSSAAGKAILIEEVQCRIARDFKFKDSDPWDIGIKLASFAQTFGARAPCTWIAHQLFYDCVRTESFYEDQMVRLEFVLEDSENGGLSRRSEMVDFAYFRDLDDGVETFLVDWWLQDSHFLLQYQSFEDWRQVVIDDMIGEASDELIEGAIEEEALAIGL